MGQISEQISRATGTKFTCYHCGENCPDLTIRIEDKFFCCNGCKLVFELLSANDLCAYYSFSNGPGSTPVEAQFSSRFAYLDDPRVVNQLLQFSDDKIGRITFHIPVMHCSSCIWLLENLFKINEAILNSSVDFLRKSLDITFDLQKISLRQLIELLASIGYEPEINLAALQKKTDHKADRDLYIKIGIAGFAFGNIMLLSLPEYLSINESLPDNFLLFFGYLSIILALPVFFYSALDYFKSAMNGLWYKTLNMDVPISMGIITLFTRSVIDIVTQAGSGFMDSFTCLVFLLLIGKLFQKRTYDNLSFDRDYRSYFPISVLKMEKDAINNTVLSQIRITDRILIRNQEIIPADAVLISGDGLIDYSFVTGESEPVRKIPGDTVYAGGKQIGNRIELEVMRDVSASYLTQLWNNPVFKKSRESRITTAANSVSKYFTVAVIAVAVLSALYWLKSDITTALNAFTAVLIVACPCALALSTPFTLGNTLRLFGKYDFYLKNSAVIEHMARVNTIVFDKTGTLTQSQPTNLSFHPVRSSTNLNPEEQNAVRSIVIHSTHPLSQLICNQLPRDQVYDVSGFQEHPGKGISAKVQNRFFKIGSAEYVGLEISQPAAGQQTRVHLVIDDNYRGFFEITQYYRPDLKELIGRLSKNCEVALLTGDNTGKKSELLEIFGKRDNLFFNQSPYDKLNYIRDKQKCNKTVMMIGDGLNDAGALRQSDVGISLTENINFFTPASDAILGARQLKNLDDFIRFSRISLKIIIASFVFSFLYNIIGLFYAVQGLLSPLIAAVLMPLSSVTVILFTTGMTWFCAGKIFNSKKESYK